MNPIDTWVDTDEIRRLAQRLVTPAKQTTPSAKESGFGDGFVGFAEIPSETAPLTTPVSALALKLPSTDSPAFKSLSNWLHAHCAATAVFVINLEGQVLFDEDSTHLHFAARGMALNWKIRDAVKPVRLLVHAGQFLELVPVNHAQGRLILGIVVPQALQASTLSTIREKIALS